MATIGYIRVSTHDQNLDLQRDAMKEAGAVRVFEDLGVSGSSTERQGLTAALDYCRDGDTFAVWRLDRLGRNLQHILSTIQNLEERGVKFRSLSDGLTTEGSMGKLMVAIIGAFAQFERDVMLERTQAGLAAAQARGSKGGRRPKLTPAELERAKKLRATNTVPELARIFSVSEPTMYRYLKDA